MNAMYHSKNESSEIGKYLCLRERMESRFLSEWVIKVDGKTETEVMGSQLSTPKPMFSALETLNSEVQLRHVQNSV